MSKSLGLLDDLLFDPAGWFAIDAGNQRVPGVVVGSLDGGLELVGRGRVATIVGRLRAGVDVIDVDLAGPGGHQVTHQLTAWCEQRGLWHLVRPSGGADGRHHVFLLPGAHREDLLEEVTRLRNCHGASAREVDLRSSRHVRPLTAPHRHGTGTRPHGDLRGALRALKRHLRATDSDQGDSAESLPVRASGAAGALTPRPRRQRPLPEPWARYLATGQAPPVGGEDQSRSTIEAIATGHLLRAGHTPASAWASILDSHPDAMARAKASRRRWVQWVWNRAVRDDEAYSPTPTSPDESLLHDVAAARGRLGELAWSLPARQRPGLLLVGHQLLDRIERAGTRRVPAPERDLVLDTGIRDRKTVRSYLRALNGPVGQLDTETWDARRRDSTSFEFEIPSTDEGVPQIPPPSFHTPSPAAGTWAHLGSRAHALWRALPDPNGTGADLEDLLHTARLVEHRSASASVSQLRRARDVLRTLATAGLASCDATGTWRRRDEPTEQHLRAAGRAQRDLLDQVETERTAYRQASTSDWSRERAAAYKDELARRKAWWQDLPAVERQRRTREWEQRFTNSPVAGQEEVKRRLATRRRVLGIDELERHAAWRRALSPVEYDDRSLTRQVWFHQLPPPLQHAYVTAWDRHRHRFGLPAPGARRDRDGPAPVRRIHGDPHESNQVILQNHPEDLTLSLDLEALA